MKSPTRIEEHHLGNMTTYKAFFRGVLVDEFSSRWEAEEAIKALQEGSGLK